MSINDIHAKLSSGEAYKSLMSEKNVAKACERLGWNVTQGCYYADPKEGKIREVDILASQAWNKKTTKTNCSVDLYLVIECKTAADYHLLFSNTPVPTAQYLQRYDHWIGSGDEWDRVVAFINNSGIDVPNRLALINRFQRIAYPNPHEYSLVNSLNINPPPAPVEVSAYRETNSKVDRELESSVLWKAVRSVHSAMKSFAESFWGVTESDFETAREAAFLMERPLPEELEFDFRMRVQHLIVFHPVIIIKSHLWQVEDRGISAIDWCRLWQPGFWDPSPSWIDVVSESAMGKYLKDVTHYYSAGFKKAKAKKESR